MAAVTKHLYSGARRAASRNFGRHVTISLVPLASLPFPKSIVRYSSTAEGPIVTSSPPRSIRGEISDIEGQPWRRDPAAVNARIIRRLGAKYVKSFNKSPITREIDSDRGRCSESYQIALQSLDQMRGNILTYRYKLPESLAPERKQHELIDVFERSLARVVLKHPLMHVGLVGEHTDKPCWVRLDSIDFRRHIEWNIVPGGSDQFQKVFLDTCYQQLDTKLGEYLIKPSWKIKVLRPGGGDFIEVLLVLNHTNMDGGSAKTFHMDLLQSLHEDPLLPKNGLLKDHILTLPHDSTEKLSPPAEDIVEFPVSTHHMIKFLQDEVRKPAAAYPKTPTQAHWAPIMPSPFKTQFRAISIPNDVLAKLLDACRHHKTTLTALLHSLVFISLTPLLDSSNAVGFEYLTAMNLRRFLPSHPPSHPWLEPSRAMSNYVTIVDHVLDEKLVAQVRSKTSPYAADGFRSGVLMDLMWSVARKTRRDIQNKLEAGLDNDMIGFWKVIGDWRAHLSEEARRPRRTSWVITNLGLIENMPAATSDFSAASEADAAAVIPNVVDPNSSWSITRTQFIMCANVVSSAIGISTAAVRDGDFIITCTWQDCVIDVKLGEAFVESLERWLKFTSMYRDGWPVMGYGTAGRF
jgi:hypothetical protein